MATVVSVPAFSSTPFSVSEAVEALQSITSYRAEALFTVSMPQLPDDVIYELSLEEKSQPSDSLLGRDYLVAWHSVAGVASPIDGFSAYCSGGDHYRYNGHRLLEYHFSVDSRQFVPELAGVQGVHLTAQFVDILPFALAAGLEKMAADSAYRISTHADTLINGRRVDAIRATLVHDGMVAQECEYVFDRTTHLPLRLSQENSPGSISEQSVSVEYTVAGKPAEDVTEGRLLSLYPDVFANLRQNNFRIESLPGTRLPGFALATSTRERYSRGTNDPFRCPTIIALLNGKDGMTLPMIKALREAADGSPVAVDIIWVFTDKDSEVTDEVIGAPREGEHILINGRSLVRDCGAADLPAVIVCNADATVKNIIVGFNNSLASDVIQMIAIM